jgi:nucleoside diphosphate kinase
MGAGASLAGLSAAVDAAPEDELKAAFGTLPNADRLKLQAALSALAGSSTNSAFVFIKPHAITDAVKALVKKKLEDSGIRIVAEGSLTGEVVDEKKLVDQHYYAIASKATILKPTELNVPKDKFKEQFGMEWEDALASSKVLNAMDACEYLGISADQMDEEWSKAKKNKNWVKLGGGFQCSKIEGIEGKEPVITFNGFFMAMRSKFTQPGPSVHYFVVEWDSAKLPWADFRGSVVGPTDPAAAPADSLRGQIFKDWTALGLSSEPNIGDNGIHASASPFEALAERCNWLSAILEEDAFGKQLLSAGLSKDVIQAWSVDPQVSIGDGKKGGLFDQVEDVDTDNCVEKLLQLSKLQ